MLYVILVSQQAVMLSDIRAHVVILIFEPHLKPNKPVHFITPK